MNLESTFTSSWQFADAVRAAVSTAYELGVRRHPASRFERYLAVLDEAASFTYPRPFPWEEAPERRHLYFEAASQGQQLIDAARVWGAMDSDVALRKVRTILSGDAMPPTDNQAEDVARNTLFELVAASSLLMRGFEVQVTAAEEDVAATYPGLPAFAVECKRPAGPQSLSRNVLKVRRQLQGRCRGGEKLGLAVIGIERILGLAGKTPNVPSQDELVKVVDDTLVETIRIVRGITRKKPLYPETPLADLLLTTAILSLDRGGIFTVSQMGLFLTGDGKKELSRRIHRTMSDTIETVYL